MAQQRVCDLILVLTCEEAHICASSEGIDELKCPEKSEKKCMQQNDRLNSEEKVRCNNVDLDCS